MKEEMMWFVGSMATLVVLAMAVLFTFLAQPVSGGFECEFHDIELVNVTPYTCYGDFDGEYCPVPQTVRCKGDAKLPAFMAGALGG